MNKVVEQYRTYLLDDDFYEKAYISSQEYSALEKNERKKYFYDNHKSAYFCKVPIDVTDEEFDEYVRLKQIFLLKKIDAKQETIRDLLIFLVFITILAGVGLALR